MFKMMIVGRRRPGQTLAAHRRHMLDVHGALVLGYISQHPALAPQRYVQNHGHDSSFRAGAPGTDPFTLNRDFVTEVSFEDPAAAARSREQPYYLQHLRGDESNFVDEASVVVLPTRERELLARGSAAAAPFKLFVFLGRGAGVEAGAFRAAWQAQGLALGASPALAAVQRHQQNDVQARPGDTPPVDGVDAFWLPDEAAVHALAAALPRAYVAPLVTAGAVREASVCLLLAREHVLHAGTR